MDPNEDIDLQEVEQEARSLGWVPEEEFKGDKDHWVSAEEFVERGRTLMPLLRSNNKRLLKDLSTANQKIGTLESKLNNATKAIEKLEKHYTEANKRAVETAKAQLKAELKQAREDGDVDKEFEIREQLDDLSTRQREAVETPPAKKDPPQDKNQLNPEFKDWMAENTWFGKDLKKTKLVTRIAEDLREEGSDLEGREFFDECVRLYYEQYGEQEEEKKPQRRQSKVESTTGRGRSNGSGKSFNDLPAEAKQACLEDADDLVGKGKRFETLDAWKKQYTKIYFSEE